MLCPPARFAGPCPGTRLASLRQHLPSVSWEGPGALRRNSGQLLGQPRPPPWAVPQVPAGPQEAPADRGPPWLFAWIPGVQGPSAVKAFSWRLRVAQGPSLPAGGASSSHPGHMSLRKSTSSCPVCAAYCSRFVASQGLRATAQRPSAGTPRATSAECQQPCGAQKLALDLPA